MRILHFSDVHLSKDKKAAVEMLVGKMIDALQKRKESGYASVDLVVFTGDFLDKAGYDKDGDCYASLTEGLEDFRRIVIKPLMAALNLPEKRFLMTMGNHEVVRKVVTEDERRIVSENRFSDLFWHVVSKDNIPWINEYCQFEKCFYQDVETFEQKQLGSYQTLTINGTSVCVASLCSTWATFTEEEKVFITKDQIQQSEKYAQQNFSEISLLIAHNHYDDMPEIYRNEIEEKITNSFQMCFVGHTHSGKNKIVETSKGNTYFSISPGLNKDNIDIKDEDYKNGFVIVDYSVDGNFVQTSWYTLDNNNDFVLKQNYGENGVSEMVIPKKTYFNCISSFIEDDETIAMMPWPRLDELKTELISGSRIIRLTALPGFGKTRLIREAFRALAKSDEVRNVLYCQTGKDDELTDEFQTRIRNSGTVPLTFIIDDCQRDIMERCVRIVNKVTKPIRLIVVDNNPYGDVKLPGCENILIQPDEIRGTVDKYIVDKIPVPRGDDRIVKEIQMLADGFPYMAILLVDAYKEEGNVALRSIQFLIDKMLKALPEEKEKQEGVMKALALFQPFPTELENEDAYEYVVTNRAISHLGDINDVFSRRGVFSETLSKYHSTLIENTGAWINVRPFPLAVWLVSKWFDEMSVKDIERLINDIQQQETHVKTTLMEGMSQRIGLMQESESAKRTIEKLNSVPNGSFCSEKVVCSELGSRLFLAMSTVNPEKVAACLRYLFKDKDTNWLKANIQGDTRRNLVWTLSKLCFAHESFEDAVIVMAQFAEAENEHWSNNSQGNLTQIFPIMLPDTEVDLQQRLAAIERLWNAGYHQQALRTVNAAFKNNGFTRIVGAENFGWHRREAYQPKTNSEVRQYWNGCLELLKKWYAEDEENTWESIVKIVESHIYDWRIYENMERYLFQLVDLVYPRMNGSWRNVYEELERLTQHLEPEIYKEEQKEVIQTQLERLRPKRFADRIMYEGRRVFDSHEMADLETNKKAKIIFEPLVRNFIDNRIYDNRAELTYLSETNVSCGLFVQELKKSFSDENLQILCDNLWEITRGQGDSAPLYFTNSVLMCFRDKDPIRDFVNKALHAGLFSVYVRALALMEDEKLNSFQKLLSLYDEGTLQYLHIDLYLNSIWGINHQQMATLLPMLLKRFPEEIVSIGAFVMRYRYWIGIFTADIKPYVREVLLKYPLLNDNQYMNVDYLSFVEEYLKLEEKDVSFAIEINRKILGAMSERMIHNSSECRLYEELLIEPYQSAIWEDFTHAFDDNKSGMLVFMQMQYEIGSGFSFAKGVLFKHVNEERLMEWGRTSTRIRHYLAQMAPVFNYKDNHYDRFDNFIMWLLDNYGNEEEVRSGVSCNMNTYSWTGAQYDLNNDKIKVLSSLLNHKFTGVREWAAYEIEECKRANEMEKSRDDFMRMHYS